MRKLLVVVVIAWGAVVIYRGVTEGLPAAPHGGRAWGAVAAFGFAITMVALGTASLWHALRHGHMRLGGSVALLAVLLGVAGTAGTMRWRGRSTARECAAALDHLRALTAASDRNGLATARFDDRRAALMERCLADPDDGQRRCVRAAKALADVEPCWR